MNAHRYRPALETLERRDTPAGTVTGSFANGTWTLVGDADANDIRINPGPEHDSFLVTGLNGTEVAGVIKPSNVKNIVVKLGESEDYVEVNDTGSEVRLRGNLKILGGDGANGVYIDRLLIGKNLCVTNGSGFDELTMSNSQVHGNVVVQNGPGGSETQIYRSSATDSSAIGGNLIIRNGSGVDYCYVNDTHIGGNVSIHNGLPDAGNVAGSVGIYNFYHQTTQSIIRGNVSVSYQGGIVDYDGIWDTEVLGNVKFDYGAGQGQLHVDGFSVVQPVHIHGNLTVLGQADTFVDIGLQYQQTGLIVDGNLTITTGGETDLIQAYLLHVGGTTRINTGDGGDTIVIDDSTFAGPVAIQTGAGLDSALIESRAATSFATQFARAFNVDLGEGDDVLRLGIENDPAAVAEMLKGGHWDGGAGEDTLDWRNLDFGLSFPAIEFFEVLPV